MVAIQKTPPASLPISADCRRLPFGYLEGEMPSVPPTVSFSIDDARVAWIIFDDLGSRANILSSSTRADFARVLGEAHAAKPKAIVLLSAKDRVFIAGADLHELREIPSVKAASDFASEGQKLFELVASSSIPVVCAIHGACAGGGFELALACHWRIATDGPVTRLGLPETSLGTLPGWGGCVRLPRLVGPAMALDHILKAQMVSAKDALHAGFIDEICPPNELKLLARSAALKLAADGIPARSVAPADRPFPGFREKLRAQSHGTDLARSAVIHIIEATAGLPFPAAFEIEARAFGEVTAGETCKNLIDVFFLKEQARKRSLAAWFPRVPTDVPPIRKVGIVGAGVMGSGIAHWIAAHGLEVVIREVQSNLLERGRRTIDGLLEEAVKRGKMSAVQAADAVRRVSATTQWEGFADCDLVIEAIVEDLGAKRALFRELAGIVRPDAILASNTSALPIEEIASNIVRPERTLGLHFFNPVSRMPLLELVLGPATSAETAERALRFVRGLEKSPVICRSSPGFIVTRVLFFYLNEAVRRWESGESAESIDSAMRQFGWPMGPLRLIDEVGVDVTHAIFGEMAHYFPERFKATAACGRLLERGLRGRKNGSASGFYTYSGGREILNPNAEAAHDGRQAAEPPGDPEAVSGPLMRIMADEAQRCLAEGVVKSPDDIDFALLSGAGFPAFRGGLMRHAKSLA